MFLKLFLAQLKRLTDVKIASLGLARRLCLYASRFKVAPNPSQTLFPCAVAEQCHSASVSKSSE